MPRRKNVPSDVFTYINTHNNDPTVCWEWLGSLGGRDGRGYFVVNDKKQLAHRVVYELFEGPIPEGMILRHKCDNPICCNPFHLQIGTRSENEKDKYIRDRAGTPRDIVVEIRRMRGRMTYADIAAHIFHKYRYRISKTGVGKILRGDRRTGEDE